MMGEMAQDPADDLELWRTATGHLGRLPGERMLDVLAAIATDSSADFEMRRNALHALGEMGDRRAIPALRAMLEAEDARVVTELVKREIPKIEAQQREATGPAAGSFVDLLAGLRQGRSLHAEVYDALRYMPGPGILGFLMSRLARCEGDVRTSVASAVGSLGEMAVRPLLAALESEDRTLRLGAIEALAFAEESPEK
jgi:HEAT repeat protein